MDHQNQWKGVLPVNCGEKLLNLESNFQFMWGMMTQQPLQTLRTKSVMVLRNGPMLFTPRDLLILDYTILETASKDQIAQFSVQRL